MITFGSYIKGFFVKSLENMASAKMWMFLMPFVVSTGLMGFFMYQSIDMVKMTIQSAGVTPEQMSGIIGQLGIVGDVFIAWCTFNVSLASVIIACREIFKVKKMNALASPEKPMTQNTAKEINKISS